MTIEERNSIKAHLNELCEWVDEQETDSVYAERDYWHEETLRLEEYISKAIDERRELEAKIDTIHKAMKAMHRVWFNLYESEYLSTDHREEYKNQVLAMACALELFKSQEAAQQALDTYSKLL